jgi:16S rRNA (cytosine1402-N4)-methyltransferase
LADAERGFGFDAQGPLDLRFDTSAGEPAWEVLESIDEDELAAILKDLGEEQFAGAIARAVTGRRQQGQPVRTARDLVQAVEAAIPERVRRQSRKHPATRVFQALRIYVNDELGQLATLLEHGLFRAIRAGGRAVVISFHSLEDRLVKQEFRNQQRWQNLTSKPVSASAAEQRLNPRSRSAKLRAALRK